MEEELKRGDTRNAFAQVKKFRTPFWARQITIKGKKKQPVCKEFGSGIDQTNDCILKIKRRVTLGRSVIMSMNKVWKGKDISVSAKCRLVQAIELSVYGWEGWMDP